MVSGEIPHPRRFLAIALFTLLFSLESRAVASTVVSVAASPVQVAQGTSSIYRLTMTRINASQNTKVNFTMSGTALLGTDYTLSGTSGQAIIKAGSSVANVILSALTNAGNSTNVVATMTLQPGTGYTLSTSNKASVTILKPTSSPTPTPTPSPTVTPPPTATPSPSPTPTSTPNNSPTPPPTPSPTPTPSSGVWIAPRTDGRPGSGTSADPYDGSTSTKLITLINNMIPGNTVIHFAAGNFYVSNLNPKTGATFLGAGKDVTNFLWDGTTPVFAMIVNWGGGTNITVSDLTLNGQQDVLGTTPNAINFFDCNNVTIRNVRVTNFKSSLTSEGFPVMIFCGNSSVTGALIEYCEIDHFVRGTPLTSTIGATLLGFGHGGGGDPTARVSGTVQGNYIHDCPQIQALGGGGTNSVFQNNLVIGAQKGWYHDSYLIGNTQVINNQFLNCTHNGIVATSNASGTDDPNNGCDGLVVANNTVTMDPTVTTPVSGIAVTGNYITNSQVYGNSVTKSTAVYTQYGFLLTGPGTIAHDNSASPGFTNIGW